MIKKKLLALAIELVGCVAICAALYILINAAAALLTGGIMAVIIGAAVENSR